VARFAHSVKRYERAESFFAVPLLVASALVVPAIVIEQSQPSATWQEVAQILNWVIWLAFLSEFVVLIYLTDNRRRWLREHQLETAIVFLTPPFLLAVFQPIRVLRLLRLVRLLRLAQTSRRIFSLEGLRFTALLTLLMTLGGGAAFASVEKGLSIDDGIYWAITTITTVGSHIEPHSTVGRLLTVMLVLVGAGFVTILTGAVAQRFIAHSAATEQHQEGVHAATESALLHELRSLSERLARIERVLITEAKQGDDTGMRHPGKRE